MPASSAGTTQTGPLGSRDYRLLLAGRAVSLTGSAIAPIALAFAVLGVSRSPAALGIVLGARMLPTVGFALVGGVWADRVSRRTLMVAADVLNGTVQSTTAVLLLTGTARLWELVVLQALGGTATAIFQPALGGVVPQLVPAEERRRANALLGTATSTTRVGGAALGGILVAFLGAGTGFVIDAATFFASAALLGRLRLARGGSSRRRSMLRELTEGWREFRSRTWIWAISAQFAVVNAVGMAAFLVLGPAVAERSLGGAAAWGLIQTALAGGLVLGGVLVLRLRVRRPLLSGPAAGLATALVLALLAAGSAPALVVLGAALLGGGLTTLDVLYTTELQNAIPSDRLSRVLAYELLASMAFIPVGAPAVGAVAAGVGLGTTLWIAAAVVAGASLAPLLVRDVRGAGVETAAGPQAALS